MRHFLVMGKLGGSFGGTERYEVITAKNEEDAGIEAWHIAKEVYQDYEANYGLLSEEECDSEEEYMEEVEGWIEYEVIKEVNHDFDLDNYLENI